MDARATPKCSIWPAALLLGGLATLAQVAICPLVMAQPAGGHGRGGGNRQRNAPPAAADVTPPVRGPEPRQRLDPGALMCGTEAQLQQHQAAVAVRLNGGEAAEPAGCHIVTRMTAITIVARHGPALTQVRTPGPPESTGWTDAAIPDAAAR